MPSAQMSSNSKISLVEQVVGELKQRIDRDVLRVGTRATSIRLFANERKVSANTVAEAYERLVALGYLESHPRSGFSIRKPLAPTAVSTLNGNNAHGPEHPWRARSQLMGQDGAFNASAGQLPNDWIESDLIKAALKSMASRASFYLMQPSDPYGDPQLRQLLQTKLMKLGIQATHRQIMTTTGSSQATDLVIRSLLRPGDYALVEDPSYADLFSNLQLAGVECLAVPRKPDGPDLAALENLARQHRPKLMFVQSVLHSPTGSSITPGNAHKLLQLAEKYDFRIIESDIYADISCDGFRLATLDQLSRVLYIGSCSKTLSASVRVGFIAASEEQIAALAKIKSMTGSSGGQLAEKLVYHSLTEGNYRRSIERLRGRLASGMQVTCDLLEQHGLTLFCRPTGGKFVWARHPQFSDSQEISTLAAANGIVIMPGKTFRVDAHPTPWFRINVASGTNLVLQRFLARLR